MSTATASDVTVPLIGGRYHFLLRRLHSLTGLVFGGYLVIHLLVNATLVQLGNVYQVQVDKIHNLPLLGVWEWLFIYLPIIYHTIYGIWITFTAQPNVERYAYFKNWCYVLQRTSAIIIVLFIIFHVFSLRVGWIVPSKLGFDPHDAAYTVHRHLTAWPWLMYWFYPLGILASCFHLANGVWTAAITWGLTVSAAAQRRWGFVCAALFVILLTLGLMAFFGGVLINPHSIAPVRPI